MLIATCGTPQRLEKAVRCKIADITKRMLARKVYSLFPDVKVSLVKLLSCIANLYAILRSQKLPVHIMPVLALDRCEQRSTQ